MRVVGLGAICDLDSSEIGPARGHSFSVSEFALLDNGERVILHDERGYSGWISAGDVWAHTTVETITRDVLTTVLPDGDDSDEEHPWWWLAELAQERGLAVTADDLRLLPYEVVLTERVHRKLNGTTSPPSDDS